MIKAVVFDVDGVITKSSYKFSNDFEKNQGLEKGTMQSFFKGPFRKCTIGEADLKEELQPFLSEWKWDKSIDELIELWFETDGLLDEVLLSYIKELKSTGIKCYIATNQEKYRAKYLLDNQGLGKLFDGNFISSDLGCKKPESDFFEEMLKNLELNPEEILFIDDSSDNIAGADKLRINTIEYNSFDIFEKELLNFNFSNDSINLPYKEAIAKYFYKEEVEDYSTEKAHKSMISLGDPLKDIKVIHIAGTNGKGSVAKMMYSILTEAGYNVGVYTQPNLVSIRERFQTNKGIMSEENFLRLLSKVLSTPYKLAFFEKSTLMAFLYFKEMKCDYAIIEVGMGGLLDTTNIVSPYITAITSIGFDHMKTLGNTLEEISFQKAGIIKPGIPVVVNHKNKVIEKVAKDKGSEIIFSEESRATNLKGEFQEQNAGIAYEMSKYLGINENFIDKGLLNAEHKGRLEYVTPNLLIDGAHNRNGLVALKKYIDNNIDRRKQIVLCVSLKHGKEIDMITNIFGIKSEYIIVDTDNIMVEKADILEKEFEEKGLNHKVLNAKSIKSLAKNNPNTLFLVFGSLYMIGDFYK